MRLSVRLSNCGLSTQAYLADFVGKGGDASIETLPDNGILALQVAWPVGREGIGRRVPCSSRGRVLD